MFIYIYIGLYMKTCVYRVNPDLQRRERACVRLVGARGANRSGSRTSRLRGRRSSACESLGQRHHAVREQRLEGVSVNV